MKLLFALVLLLASVQTCIAEPLHCDVPDDPSLGRIVAPSRVHLRSDLGGCLPEVPRCVMSAYVVPGDFVLLGPKRGALQCAIFPNADRGRAGWLPVTAMQTLPVSNTPPLTAWTGKWVLEKSAYNDITINIRREGAKLVIDGHAIWPGSEGARRDWTLKGKMAPDWNILMIERKAGENWERAATAKLIGPYLVVKETITQETGLDGDEWDGEAFNGAYFRR